jgi:hypothetical protein
MRQIVQFKQLALGAIWVVMVGLLALPGCTLTPANPTAVLDPVPSVVVPDAALVYQQTGRIWLANTDTTNPQVVSPEAALAYQPIWVPHSDSIIYGVVNEPYFELWLHNLTTGKLTLLTAGRTAQEQLQVAPNGQYLSYLAGADLYLLDLGTNTTSRLDEHTTYVSWSPDSRTILFSTDDGRLLQRQFRATGELDAAEVVLTQVVAWPSWADKHTVQFLTTHTSNDATTIALDQYDLMSTTQHTNLILTNPTLADIAQFDVIADTGALVLLVDGTLLQYTLGQSAPITLATNVAAFSLAPNDELLYYAQANRLMLTDLTDNTTTILGLTDVTHVRAR